MGIDVSSIAVERACKNGIEASVCDLEGSFPFPDDKFDVSLAIEVFEYLFDPAATLGEIKRVLKQSGFLTLTVPNGAHFRERINFFLLGRFNPRGSPDTSFSASWKDPHIRFFTESSLSRMLFENGFEIQSFRGYGLSLWGLSFIATGSGSEDNESGFQAIWIP